MSANRAYITNISRVESLIADPPSDISLKDLIAELNELAALRQNARLAFCKRLAIAYMLLIGRRVDPGAPRDGGSAKFQKWCDENLKTANNKRYSSSTIRTYLTVGFAGNPEKYYEERSKINRDCAVIRHRKDERDRKIGLALVAAASSSEPQKVVSIASLKRDYELTSNVAQEVNKLMTAWEQASTTARKQFLKLVAS